MLWEAWVLSKTWRCRPSELFDLHDGYVAYCFDRAVAAFGMAVEQDLDAASDGAKTAAAGNAARQRRLARWLTLGDAVPAGIYRDPRGA